MKTIKRAELPLIIGALLAGGLYTGEIRVGDQNFALVTAHKSDGELRGKFGEYGQEIQGAMSCFDGFANTEAMAAAGSDLAQRVRALRIAELDDWYLGARDEVEMQYRAFKPTDDDNYCYFRDGDNPSSVPAGYLYTPNSPAKTDVENADFDAAWYWTSTQSGPGGAWCQIFVGGHQDHDYKGGERLARAVRRILIID